MNKNTKKTLFTVANLTVGAVSLMLGGFAFYNLGMLNHIWASDSNLSTQGVQNKVQYLTSLVMEVDGQQVKFEYDKDFKGLKATGPLNMANVVVGGTNQSLPSSMVFGGKDSKNLAINSVLAASVGTTVEGDSNFVAISDNASVNAEDTVLLRGDGTSLNQVGQSVVLGANNQFSNIKSSLVIGNGNQASNGQVLLFGDNINAQDKAALFVFNGKEENFAPRVDSAFYTNGKLAINSDSPQAQLDVNGGMKIAQSDINFAARNGANAQYGGVMASFTRNGTTGLCGLDGKANRRVPLSESARADAVCASNESVQVPAHGVTVGNVKSPNTVSLPQQWYPKTGTWGPRQWIYGNDQQDGWFLCQDGYVPDNKKPIGKTGVGCIKCGKGSYSKSGDLNCRPCSQQEADSGSCELPVDTTPTSTRVDCDASNVPANATASSAKVKKNADGTTPACGWICNTNYTKSGNRCVKNKKTVSCDASQIPENAIAVDNTETIDIDGTIPACDWFCNAGYRKQGNSCVAKIDGECGVKTKTCNMGVFSGINRTTWRCLGKNGGKDVFCPPQTIDLDPIEPTPSTTKCQTVIGGVLYICNTKNISAVKKSECIAAQFKERENLKFFQTCIMDSKLLQ